MGKLITITKDENEKRPKVICPHCKKTILVSIKPFEKDVSKILQDNCPKCGGAIFMGLFILCHPNLQGLMSCIQLMIQSVNTENKILG